MKTAVSLPDPIFQAAEQLAQRLGVSRSELYAKAISVYLEACHGQDITERLNQIYAEEASQLDPAVQALQSASLPKDRW